MAVTVELMEPKVIPTEDVAKHINENKLWISRTDRNLWLGTLFCGCAALYASRTTMPITIVAISKEFKWSKTDSGTVLSSFFWGYSLTQVIGGYLSDKLDAEFILMTAAIGWSLLTFWTPQIIYLFHDASHRLYFLVFTRIVMGACQGVHFPSVTSLSSTRLPEIERTLFYSTASSGIHLGTIFSGSVGSFVLDTYGWAVAFHLIGIMGLSWVLFLRYFVIERQRQEPSSIEPSDGTTSKPQVRRDSVPWLQLFRHSAFWAMIASHLCDSCSMYILISWLPSYFHENFPGTKGWVYNVIPWVICIPSSISGGWIAQHLITRGYSVTLVRKLMEAVAQLGRAFFLFMIGFASTFGAALTCMALAIACGGFHNCAVFINPQDIAPKYAGSVFGLMNMAGAIPGFVGVYVVGHILETTGSWTAVFNGTGFINVLGCIVFLMYGSGSPIVS